MKISEWADMIGITNREAAERLGIARSCITDWAAGRTNPSFATALRIERETGGHVRVEDIVPEMLTRTPKPRGLPQAEGKHPRIRRKKHEP